VTDPLVIRGYATLFGVCQTPLEGSARPFVATARGFDLARPRAALLFSHDPGTHYASTGRNTLRMWKDATGIAFTADIAPTSAGYGLFAGIVDGRFNQCSMLLTNYRTECAVHNGVEVDMLVGGGIGEISIAVEGACPGTCAWSADSHLDDLPPRARRLAPHWMAGQVRHRRTSQLRAAARPSAAPRLRVPNSVVALLDGPAIEHHRRMQTEASRLPAGARP
jgi:hypothetical protein